MWKGDGKRWILSVGGRWPSCRWMIFGKLGFFVLMNRKKEGGGKKINEKLAKHAEKPQI